MRHELASHAIMTAQIDGIGGGTKARLLAAGIFTAADIVQVSYQPTNGAVELIIPGGHRVQVAGLGPARAAALASWRHRLEAACRATQPAALPVSEEKALRAAYLTRRHGLDRQAAAATAATQQRGDRLRQQAGQQQTRLAGEIQAVRDRYGQQQTRLADEMTTTRDRLADQQRQLAAVQQELQAYERVTVRAYVRRLLFLPND